MNKKELRSFIKQKRIELFKSKELEKISSAVVDNILSSEIFKNSSNVALYYPLDGEIDLRALLDYDNKSYYLPKCIDDKLYFAKYNGKLNKGAFNTQEPVSDCINPDILDIILIPALCCNSNLYRLGYGKGFYDRFFFENQIKAKKIIVCAKSFITDDFIQDEYDYKCDYVLCEDGIF